MLDTLCSLLALRPSSPKHAFQPVTRSRPLSNVLHNGPRRDALVDRGLLPQLTRAGPVFLRFRVSASAGGYKLIGGGEHLVTLGDPLKACDAK